MTPDMAQLVLVTSVTAATPLFLAALGELVAERSGVLNLGVEGMMIVGAASGFAEGVGSWLAGLASAAASALAAPFAAEAVDTDTFAPSVSRVKPVVMTSAGGVSPAVSTVSASLCRPISTLVSTALPSVTA